MRFIKLFSAATMLLSTFAVAADYPPAIQNLVDHNGLEVVSRFDAPGGLTGYAARVQGREVIVYAVDGGRYAIAGTMLDGKGDDLTSQQVDRYLTAPLLKTAWSRLAKATWIAEGSANPKRIVYEFTDPNCPFCHLYWLANQPYLKHGLQVRHILVGVVTPDSLNKAAAILEADDPVAAMTKNERDYHSSGPENEAGGVAPLKHPKPETVAKIKANNALMKSLGVNGTPGILYRDAKGQVHRATGLPRLSQLPKMYRLPPQPVTDPRLKRYQ